MSLGDGDSGFQEQDPQQENTTSDEADTQATTDSSVKIAGLTLSNDGFLPTVGLTNAQGDTIATLKVSSVLKLFETTLLTAEDFKFANGITPEQQQQIVTQANQYLDQTARLFSEQYPQYSYDSQSQRFYDDQNSKEISLLDILKLLIQFFNQTVMMNIVVVQQQGENQESTFEMELDITDSEGNKSTLKSSKYPLTMDNVEFIPEAPEDAEELLQKMNACYADTMQELSKQHPGLTFENGEPRYNGKPLTAEQFAGKAKPFTDGKSFNDRFKDAFNENAAKYKTKDRYFVMVSCDFAPQATQQQQQSVAAELTAGQELNPQPETNSTQQAKKESGDITQQKAQEQDKEETEKSEEVLADLEKEVEEEMSLSESSEATSTEGFDMDTLLDTLEEELAELDNQIDDEITDDEAVGLEQELEELMSKEEQKSDSEDSTSQQQTETALTTGDSMSPKPSMLSKAATEETESVETELLSSSEQKLSQSPDVELDDPDIDLSGPTQ